MALPILANPIPDQVTNEQAAYGPFDLTRFVQAPVDGGALFFEASIEGDAPLPQGLICTRDGILTGIPAKGTHGLYQVRLVIGNESGTIETDFVFTIKPSLAATQDHYTQLKQQIWEALEQRLPVPEIAELYNRPISQMDVYYLLTRWGVIKIWDAYNLDAPGDLIPLELTNASPLYRVYDRGSCLVAGPKDIFSHEHTLQDGIKTAKALAQEAFKRNWTIEVSGLDKLTRAIWVEVQLLGERHGHTIDVINYEPTEQDKYLVTAERQSAGIRLEAQG